MGLGHSTQKLCQWHIEKKDKNLIKKMVAQFYTCQMGKKYMCVYILQCHFSLKKTLSLLVEVGVGRVAACEFL